MAKKGIPVVMLVTERTPIDAKGGVFGMELIEGTSLSDPDAVKASQMVELAQAKAAEATGVEGESDRFSRIGLDDDEATYGDKGHEAFNTNVAAVNETVVGEILTELEDVLVEHYSRSFGPDEAREKAWEKLSEITGPNLIEKLVYSKDGSKSHVQLEGAMGLALLSLNRFFEHPNERGEGFDVAKIRDILSRRQLRKIVTPVFFTAAERDVVFTPVKTGFDAWFQMFGGFYTLDIMPGSQNRWRYKAISPDNGGIPAPPEMDIDLKDPHWSEIQSWTDTFGRHSDTRDLTRIKLKLATRGASVVVGNAVMKGEVEISNQSNATADLRDLETLPRSSDGRVLLENVRITVRSGDQPLSERVQIETIGTVSAEGARLTEDVPTAEGARMAEGLSAEVVKWVKWAGEVEPRNLKDLTGPERDALAHVASNALAPNQTADVPMVFIRGEQGPAQLTIVKARFSGKSVDLSEGATSVSVGLSSLTTLDTDAGRKAVLDEQAGDMSAFSGSLRALLDAFLYNKIEVPVHFLRSLDDSSVDQDRFTGDEAKVAAFATWVRQMALVYKLAHEKDNRIVLHLVTKSLKPALKAAVEKELKRYESEGWLDLVREGDVDADELARTGALLVDVKTVSPSKYKLAAGAHVVGRLTSGSVPDEAAAVAASLNTVGAVKLGDGASALERFASGEIQGDVNTLDRIKQNYDEANRFFTLPEHVDQFRNGNLERVTRILKISIGRLLQTMRMMITQVAMAA